MTATRFMTPLPHYAYRALHSMFVDALLHLGADVYEPLLKRMKSLNYQRFMLAVQSGLVYVSPLLDEETDIWFVRMGYHDEDGVMRLVQLVMLEKDLGVPRIWFDQMLTTGFEAEVAALIGEGGGVE